MEISLHLKPLPLAAVAVCRLIYCRLSPDCQLSTTNRATRAKQQQQQNQTKPTPTLTLTVTSSPAPSASPAPSSPFADTRYSTPVNGAWIPVSGHGMVHFGFGSISLRPSVCLSVRGAPHRSRCLSVQCGRKK